MLSFSNFIIVTINNALDFFILISPKNFGQEKLMSENSPPGQVSTYRGTTLDCKHWFWDDTHKSVTFGSGWDTLD